MSSALKSPIWEAFTSPAAIPPIEPACVGSPVGRGGVIPSPPGAEPVASPIRSSVGDVGTGTGTGTGAGAGAPPGANSVDPINFSDTMTSSENPSLSI